MTKLATWPRKPVPAEIDYCTAGGANILASRIRKYWYARGYDVVTKVEAMEMSDKDKDKDLIYVVRSNLGANGMPIAKLTDEKAAA